jgi:hypothetical protein
VALNTIILLKNTPTEIHRTQEKNKKNKKHNTTFVEHHYTQANTNNGSGFLLALWFPPPINLTTMI